MKARAEKARSILGECRLCPRHCGVSRRPGKNRRCHITGQAVNRQEFLEALNLAHQQDLYKLDKVYTSLPLKLISK